MTTRKAASVAAIFFAIASQHASARQDSYAPHFGYVVWTDAVVVAPGDNEGFSLSMARLRVSGGTERIRYFIQPDFTRSDILMDARLTVEVAEGVDVVAGLFKSPFSAEVLLSSADIPLFDRARVAKAIATNRRVGAGVRISHGSTKVDAGLFNPGDRSNLGTGPEGFMAVGRLSHTAGRVRVGLNVALGDDDDFDVPNVGSDFTGQRVAFGADLLFADDDTWILVEAAGGSFDPEVAAADEVRPWGLAATARRRIAGPHHLVGRVDAFEPDNGSDQDVWLAIAYQLNIGPIARLLAGYTFPAEDAGEGTLQARLQVAMR